MKYFENLKISSSSQDMVYGEIRIIKKDKESYKWKTYNKKQIDYTSLRSLHFLKKLFQIQKIFVLTGLKLIFFSSRNTFEMHSFDLSSQA